MTDSRDIIQELYNKQKEYGYLKSIILNRSLNDYESSVFELTLILCTYPYYEEDNRLILTFKGVRDFKINNIHGLLKLVLSVVDVSSHQNEGIRYQVQEQENQILSFYCQSIKSVVVE